MSGKRASAVEIVERLLVRNAESPSTRSGDGLAVGELADLGHLTRRHVVAALQELEPRGVVVRDGDRWRVEVTA